MLSNDYWLSGFFICKFPLGAFLFIGYDCSMFHGLTIIRSVQVRLVGSCNGTGLSDAWLAALISN